MYFFYLYLIFTISLNHENVHRRSVHTYSQTLNFFTPQIRRQCKILVISNDNIFCFFVFYKCANKTDLESFSTQCESPGSFRSSQSSHSTSVLPSQSLNTAPLCFAFHFQVKCSSKNHTA